MKLPIIHLFGEITRRDDQERIVEGYVYVNPEVGDGVKLTRSAMEAATDDYMRWGAVREMHGRNAAGTAVDLTWDDKGAYFRCKIIDDAAWEKCKEGVYKGFSVGVKPLIVRGKDVTRCLWVENSLVDRPKDPDAAIALHRAEGYQGETEFDVEEETVERGAFADQIDARAKASMRDSAWYLLSSVLYDIQNGNDSNKATLVRQACSEFADFLVPLVERAEFGAEGFLARAEDLVDTTGMVALERFETVDAERAGLLTRVETAEAEVTRLTEVASNQEGLLTRVASVVAHEDGTPLEVVVGKAVEKLMEPDPAQQKPMKITAKALVERIQSGGTQEELDAKAKASERMSEIFRMDWGSMDQAAKDQALLEIEGLKKSLAG